MVELMTQEGAFRCETYQCVMRKEVCKKREDREKCNGCNLHKTYLRIDWAYQLWGDNITLSQSKTQYRSVIKQYQV